MLWMYKRENSGIRYRMAVNEFTPKIVELAMAKFKDLQTKGVILSEFQDDIWVLSKQTKKTYVKFSESSMELGLVCESSKITYEEMIQALKIYVITKLQTCEIESLTTLVSTIIRETIKSSCYNVFIPFPRTMHQRIAKDYIAFVRVISPNSSSYLDNCQKCLRVLLKQQTTLFKGNDHACTLAEFESFFVYDEIMRNWWQSDGDYKLKLYFYPLYLFWSITTILPLRVNEFCYMPYDCITHVGTCYRITVRRSRLKGHDLYEPKLHAYTLEKDYELCSYEIPEWLYNEIENYRHISKDHHRNHNLLFSLEYMYENKPGRRTKPCDRDTVFNDEFLGNLQRDFYLMIIEGEYDYHLVSESTLAERSEADSESYQIQKDEILFIRSKETRHLAMINLILRGCNPIIIKDFAGHANEAMSAHYYSNFGNIIRTTTVRLFEQSSRTSHLTKEQTIPQRMLINPQDDHTIVDAGRCYSKNFINGNIQDCSSCGGDCRNCRWLIPKIKDDYTSLFDDVNESIRFIVSTLKNAKTLEQIRTYQVEMQKYYKLQSNVATRIWQEVQNGEN